MVTGICQRLCCVVICIIKPEELHCCTPGSEGKLYNRIHREVLKRVRVRIKKKKKKQLKNKEQSGIRHVALPPQNLLQLCRRRHSLQSR